MKIEDITQEEDNLFSCSYDGVAHEFILELPEDTQGAPLVILLHGYGNTAKSFRSSIHFEEKANPLGYAVVYVTGAANPGDATSAVGWNSGMSAEGNDDVVPKNSDGSAKYSKAPAIEDVMDYWVKANGLEATESSEIGKGSVFTKYAKEGKDKQV